MDLIRPNELEKLLYMFNDIKTAASNLRRQLEAMQGNPEEAIESLTLRSPNLAVVPALNNLPADRTAKIAATYEKAMSHEASELRSNLLILEVIRDKIEVSLCTLDPRLKKIIEKRYFNKENWVQISMSMHASVSNVQLKRKQALERLRRIAQISLEEYEKCLKILNG